MTICETGLIMHRACVLHCAALSSMRVRHSCVQLRNFAVPASLEGLSVGTVLLATSGNALMVPRALISDDLVWFAG